MWKNKHLWKGKSVLKKKQNYSSPNKRPRHSSEPLKYIENNNNKILSQAHTNREGKDITQITK